MMRGTGNLMRMHLSSGRLFLLGGLYTLLMLILTVGAQAATAASGGMPAPLRLKDVGRGSLLFATEQEGVYLPAPTVATDVKMDVGGMVARVSVKQKFFNPTKSWLEGVYVFPLPENSAVDRMRLRVGERVIEADIAERQAARRTYEKARREGRRAGLVEQERPNIFTTSVANIAPGESVSVEIRYQETLRYDQGKFRLRFPMVVGPRYIPGPVTTVSADGDGWAKTANRVADADRISPPVLPPDGGKINPVTMRIALDAGFPLASLNSPYHRIVADDWADGKTVIRLAKGAVPADRDFELVWEPDVGQAPLAGVFKQAVDGDTYLLVMVLPPKPRLGTDGENAIPPRDVIFVLDRSGSMGGPSIVQARQALTLALDRLRPRDRFNVIWFNNSLGALFGHARAATPAAIMRAQRFVADIEADGGTEMRPALERALTGAAATNGRLRQVVFLTDGAVGNEKELFQVIADRLGDSRLFTVGIGSAPNSYFMRKAAEAGRGTFIHIGKTSEVGSRMTDLFRKLETPAVTDLMTAWRLGDVVPLGGGGVQAYPRVLPDLYDGEPLVLAVRVPGVAALPDDAALTLHGRALNRPWQRILTLGKVRKAAGVAALWGRARIAALMDSLREGASKDDVRAAVIETALRHKLVSKFTSLVAVDKTPARPANAELVSAKAPINLPRGWDYEKVFGDILKRGTAPHPIRLDRRADAADPAGAGKVTRARAAAPASTPATAPAALPATPVPLAQLAQSGNPVALPQGGTASALHLLVGGAALLLCFLMLALTFIRRRSCA